VALAGMARLPEVDVLITDDKASKEMLRGIRLSGVKVIVAKP
jgi:DeoR/GlpR family transcriptional regulator of sugar metabolism